MYVMANFEIHKFGRYLAKFPITRFLVHPYMLRLLIEADLPPEVFEAIAAMHSVLIGGASLPRILEDQFNAKINSAKVKRTVIVDQIWGMTEAGWVRKFRFTLI
jgi:acyl-coenzyme A synthetase/AMP-(fatty) acid ligase